ncbi:MAG: hypothetical protein K0Q84_388, partial [Arthrobacter sp.]|nr:hypothetical protein [Arthrobacter sp.]
PATDSRPGTQTSSRYLAWLIQCLSFQRRKPPSRQATKRSPGLSGQAITRRERHLDRGWKASRSGKGSEPQSSLPLRLPPARGGFNHQTGRPHPPFWMGGQRQGGPTPAHPCYAANSAVRTAFSKPLTWVRASSAARDSSLSMTACSRSTCSCTCRERSGRRSRTMHQMRVARLS